MRRLSDTLFLTWLSVLFMLSAFPAQALTCKTTSSTISEVVNIESIIKVSSSELIANKRYGSPALLPPPSVAKIPIIFRTVKAPISGWIRKIKPAACPTLSVGITYNGIDYLLQNKNRWRLARRRCVIKAGIPVSPRPLGRHSARLPVYIISTGRRVTGEGKIDDNLKLSLFQVDGQGGLRNGTAGANYNLFITGLNRIRTMACVPTVSISPSEINFGDIPAGNARPGYYEKHAPLPSPMVWSSRVTAVIAGPNLCLLRLAPLIRYRRAPLFCRSRTAASALPSRQTPACIPLLR